MEVALDVMEKLRPNVSLSTLDNLLMSKYRLKILEIIELNGAEDRNFRVVCQELEPMGDIVVGNLGKGTFLVMRSKYYHMLPDGNIWSAWPETYPYPNSTRNCDNYGFLAEDVSCEDLGLAATASELRNENPGVASNSTAISTQNLKNDTSFDCSLSTNASSSECDGCVQFDCLVKVTSDDCESISKAEKVELQMKIASYLINCGFNCPEAVMSASTGSLVQELTMNCDGESVKYLVYLMKYIFGSNLSDLCPLSLEVMFEVGNLLAQLHQSLKDINISHEKLSSTSPWSLENADIIKDFLSEVELDAAEQELASNVLDNFSQNVLPLLNKLPQGVIHGDFHDENILLLKKTEVETTLSVEKDDNNSAPDDRILTRPEYIRAKYAVIDFGDVSHSPFVFDLAIATSYFMMCDPRPDFTQNVAHFLCGYFTSYKPTALELRSLFSSVCAAYCRETVLSKYTYIEQSRSNEYLLTAVDKGWRQLKVLCSKGEEDILNVWLETFEKYGLLLEF